MKRIVCVVCVLLAFGSAVFCLIGWRAGRDAASLRAAWDEAAERADAVVEVVYLSFPLLRLNSVYSYMPVHNEAAVTPVRAVHRTVCAALNKTVCTISLRAAEMADAPAEGRWYAARGECCVNRALFDALCEKEGAAFSGLGGALTLRERDVPASGYTLEENSETRALTMTVVGVVDAEGEFASSAFGSLRIYMPLEDVTYFFNGYSGASVPAADSEAYAPYQARRAMRLVAYNPATNCYLTQNDAQEAADVLSAEEVRARLGEPVVNAGLQIEITFDSAAHAEDFLSGLNAGGLADSRSVAQYVESAEKKNAQYAGTPLETVNSVFIPPWARTLMERGEGEAWLYASNLNVYARRVPRDSAPIRAQYEPLLAAAQTRAVVCCAAAAALLAAAILCGVLAARSAAKERARHV